MAQHMTTRIQTKTDHAISDILKPLEHTDAILLACDLLGKNPSSYAHLDNGRRKMCAGNMLRAAARHDSSIVEKVRTAAFSKARDPKTVDMFTRAVERAHAHEAATKAEGEPHPKFKSPPRSVARFSKSGTSSANFN